LESSDYPNLKVLVLDNASTDDSLRAIGERFPAVQIMALEQNLGYAGNNNVGIEAALRQGADWVFVLNEDTLLAPDCIRLMVACAGREEHVGIVGPMVYHHSEPQVIQSAGGIFGRDLQAWHTGQNEQDVGQFGEPRPVGWISGCAILVRREVIEQVGALDERFFYYFEETEWCLRAGKAGWKVYHVPEAKLWHKGVQRDYKPNANVTYYATRNRFLMLAKHRAPLWAWLVAIGQIGKRLVSWSVKPKWRPMREHRDALWQGVADFLGKRWGMRGRLQ
jgi:GT2 family glycosyltransferase